MITPFLALLKGIGVGLLISIPTGPVGFLCVRRTIIYGKRSGLASGLGSVAADMLYASVVLFSLTRVSHFFVMSQPYLRAIGGIILTAMGISFLINKKQPPHIPDSPESIMGSFFSTFLITITNPIQIISFGIIFSLISAVEGGPHAIILFLLGLICGAFAWWVGLTLAVDYWKHKITDKIAVRISQISGIVVFVTGIIILLGLVFHGILHMEHVFPALWTKRH